MYKMNLVLEDIIKKTKFYSVLSDNLNVYNNNKLPNCENIDNIIKLFYLLTTKNIISPKIIIDESDTIGFFWGDKKKYVKINFNNDGTFTYFIKNKNIDWGETGLPLNDESDKLPDLLINFLKQF